MRRHAKAPSAVSIHANGRKARGLFGLACLCILGLAAFLGTSAPSVGAAESFPGQGFLPNDRAWELVSPPDKEGGEVIANTTRERAAADGNAFQFASMQAFGDAIGTGMGTEYMAERSESPDPGHNGWSTHAITPRQESHNGFAAAFNLETAYQGALSDDLDKGAIRTWSPIPGAAGSDPNVENVINVYVRDDLRSPGAGSYRLASPCEVCTEALPFFFKLPFVGTVPAYAGASEDFEHLIFESAAALAGGAAPFSKNLYEWHDGDLRLAGILPDGSPAPSSGAGSGAESAGVLISNLNPISADGSRIAFTLQESATAGLGISGQLYQRINGRSTIQLNASELPVPDSPSSARYRDASDDHSRVFFESTESLTEDAAGSTKLYMWEQADHDERQSITVDATEGTFTLSFHGQATEPLDSDASPAEVQSALEDLVSVKAGNVSVSGGPGSAGGASPYIVTFTGDFSGANVAELVADGSGLSGGAASATVTTTEPVENLTFLNLDQEPADTVNSVSGVIGSSRDGRYVYFTALGRLVPEAPVTFPPATLLNKGIYVWHEGAISYIGETDLANFGEWFPGAPVNFSLRPVEITPDGRHLLFGSRNGSGLLSAHGETDYEHNDFTEYYLYSAETDELACVSCNPSGAPATSSAVGRHTLNSAAAQKTSYLSRILSTDGRYAFFSTAEALVPEDINKRFDAYVYDNQTGKPSLLSTGTSPAGSYFLDASANGKDAFFVTQEQLSDWDVDSSYDLYDARVGGGFPEPSPPPPSCQGDACQPAPLQLNDPTPSSSAIAGAGNERGRKARARCPKGKQRVKARNGKTRCVKRKRTNRKRAAKNNRRAGR